MPSQLVSPRLLIVGMDQGSELQLLGNSFYQELREQPGQQQASQGCAVHPRVAVGKNTDRSVWIGFGV